MVNYQFTARLRDSRGIQYLISTKGLTTDAEIIDVACKFYGRTDLELIEKR